MPYIQRDETSKVVGVFANLQPGYAEEELPDDDEEVLSYLKPPPGPFSLPKLLLWTRLTDDEASMVDGAMASQPARLRGIWNSATEVRSDSEFFGTLQAFLTAVLGADRAVELLAPEG